MLLGLHGYVWLFCFQYTQKTAKSLHLVGWVMNTSHNTVQGQVQGPENKVKEMYVPLCCNISLFYKVLQMPVVVFY